MKKLTSFVAILVLICLLIPSLTFAAWWNPFSWFETKNNAEISMEISSSTPSASAEIKTESNWWNPFSWVKKEKTPKQEIISQENLASTTEEIISENDGLDSETPADLEMETAKAKAIEMETAKAEAEAEKYKSEAEQAKLEVEKLKRESESKMQIQTQTQTEVKKEENKNTTVTLPSGAIVEMDEYGNIVRTIQEAPQTSEVANTDNFQKLEITSVKVIVDENFATFEWETNIPTRSKVFISGENILTEVKSSLSTEMSTKHMTSVFEFPFCKKVYTYEIEAVMDNSTFVKNTGIVSISPTWKICSEDLPPQNSLITIKQSVTTSANFNPEIDCDTLSIADNDRSICWQYRLHKNDYYWNIIKN